MQIVKEPCANVGEWSWPLAGNEEMKFPKAENKGEKTVGENKQKCN